MKKSIMVRAKNQGDVITNFSNSYPSNLFGVLSEEKYLEVVSKLNGFYSVYNYKPLICTIVLLFLGMACVAFGGVSGILLDDNSQEIYTSPPLSLFITQTILFSFGGIFFLNSFVFIFYIKKKPTSNVQTIKDALNNINVEYLSQEITFSLEFQDNNYYLRLIFPGNLQLSSIKGFKENSPLMSKQTSSYEKLKDGVKNKLDKNVTIYDPSYSTSSDEGYEQNTKDNNDDESNNEDQSSSEEE
ncbi:hypothetical protein RB653_005330 [Dictyostelium firmibasis]|uniref:Uncharacterized protein n=1 Tax=Dictyostelium firmibasis TaxID=79012 RepID=A0AAN7Z0Z3_9MYCE